MNDPIDTTGRPPRQRSARNDPTMRDGDMSHGSPGDIAGDEVELDSDSDVGDDTRMHDMLPPRDLPTAGRTAPVDPDALDGVTTGRKGPDVEAEDEEEEFAAEAARANLPVPGYDGLSIASILDHAAGLTVAEIDRLIEFERGHRNRRVVLDKLAAVAAGRDPAEAGNSA